jgi:hypothetical protein
MKRRIKKMKKTLLFVAIMFMALTLTSCFTDVSTLEIVSVPKLEFIQDENFTVEDFIKGLRLRVNNGAEFDAAVSNTTISGFDLSKAPGIYSATVSYSAGGISASASFMYTIKPKIETYGFANHVTVGNVHQYTISNVNHFRNIAIGNYEGKNDPTTYFILSNDLDFENTSPWIGYEEEIGAYKFTGTFDGNGHVVKNLHSTVFTSSEAGFNFNSETEKPTVGLFFEIEDATFKNITFDNCIIGDEMLSKGVGLLGVGRNADALTTKTLSIINVTVNSNCVIQGNQNAGGLVGYGFYNLNVDGYEFNGTVKAPASSAAAIIGSNRPREGVSKTINVTNSTINGVVIAESGYAIYSNDATGTTVNISNSEFGINIYRTNTSTSKFYPDDIEQISFAGKVTTLTSSIELESQDKYVSIKNTFSSDIVYFVLYSYFHGSDNIVGGIDTGRGSYVIAEYKKFTKLEIEGNKLKLIEDVELDESTSAIKIKEIEKNGKEIFIYTIGTITGTYKSVSKDALKYVVIGFNEEGIPVASKTVDVSTFSIE